MRINRLAVLAILIPSGCFAATIHVPGTWPTIQQAVNNSAAGDVIVVDPGTYPENVQILTRGPLSITSASGPAVTTVDGGMANAAFYVFRSTSISISGFTITHGRGAQGGGVWIDRSASVTVQNNVITNNTSQSDGGGVSVSKTTDVVIADNQILSNSANYALDYDGGGIYHYQTSGVIRNNVVSDNSAQEGGGIIINQSTSPSLEVSGNIFTANHATGSSTIAWGGGIYVNIGTAPYLHNNTLYANSAPPNSGGGIWYNSPSSPVIANNIVDSSVGGGIMAYASGATPTFSCNDVDANAGGNYIGFVGDQTGSNGNISFDPDFCSPGTGSFYLSFTSPCAPLNSGSCGLIGALDVGCGPTKATPASWGAIKQQYRR